MDEPFTGLDPVNLVLLREAFIELRDQGRTLIFSTHQMEAAEALCESVAIVDRGRLVAGGTLRDLKRASGRRWIRLALEGRARRPAWLGDLPGVDVVRRERRGRRARAAAGRRARRDPRRASSRRGATVSHFEVVEPTLEALFIELVGRPAGRRRARWPASAPPPATPARPPRTAGLMARRDPLLPNAGIVARREYRDRSRSPLFLGSTIVLMALALVVAVAPIAIRYLDRRTVTRIAVVVVATPSSARRAVGVADSILNDPPGGRRPGDLGEAVPRRARRRRGGRRARPAPRPSSPAS